MKTPAFIKYTIILLLSVINYNSLHAQNTFPSSGNVGIGTTAPFTSSALEIKSTTKGMLIPRMTIAQRNLIPVSALAKGLLIYQTNTSPGFYYYTGTAWTSITAKDTTLANRALSNLASTTSVNVNLIPQTNNKSSLGTSVKRWKTLSLYNLNFANNTTQTTAFIPYTAGTGISISGTKISATGGGSGANTSLSNLTLPTAINRDLIPFANATNDVGSFNSGWRNGYFSGTLFTGGVQASSTGNFTAVIGSAGDGVGVNGTSTGTSSTSYGVYGSNSNGIGIKGNGIQGIYGQSNSTDNSGSDAGVHGIGYIGVRGETDPIFVNGGFNEGILGTGLGTNGWGVEAYSSQSTGILAGTGNTSDYAGYFNGNIFTSASYQGSDRNLKQNIKDISSGMDIINKLRPKTYNFKQDSIYKLMNLPLGKHFGLIAQDVELVLPDMVKESHFEKRMAGPFAENDLTNAQTKEQTVIPLNFKALNYTELIPIIIKGMQELNSRNNSKDSMLSVQQDEINVLKSQVAELKTMVQQLNVNKQIQITTLSSASLDQNIPNPFKGSTTIGYTLPSSYSSAQLIVSDIAGGTLKVIALSGKGKGSVVIDLAKLSAGAYTYTLFIDTKLIDTKKNGIRQVIRLFSIM